MSKQALAVKYRPKKFEDVVEQDVPKAILTEQLKDKSFKNCILFCGGAGTGKAQPLYSKVLTPEGFITMGEVEVGTKVITGNGNISTVTGVYPQGTRPIYEITLSNKIKFRVSDEHLNVIYTEQDGQFVESIVTTKTLLTLKRKETYIKKTNSTGKECAYFSISIIKKIGEEECQCIYVEADEHTYITDGYVVTHNTTSARIFAKEVNDFKGHVIEIDAASHNSVEDARKIIEDAKTQSLDSEYKVFLLDECFHEDTLVSTVNGLKKISEIELGEEVYNLTGKGSVIGISRNKVAVERLVIVETTNGPIVTTVEHLFFTTRDWVQAQELIGYEESPEKEYSNPDQLIDCEYLQKILSTNYYNSLDPKEDKEPIIREYMKYRIGTGPEVIRVYSYVAGNRKEFEKYFTKTELNFGYVVLYDLQVSSHPSYFVNDILVHNCHMLSNSAWNAMLKIIEEPPKKTLILMATTDPQKIPNTILSRVQRFNFQKISLDGIVNRLKFIIESENKETCGELCNDITSDMDVLITYEDSALEFIAKMADGGMRDSITLLDKCLGYSNHLTLDNVLEAIGAVNYDTMFELTDSINVMNAKRMLEIIETVHGSGLDLKQFMKQYCNFVIDLCKYDFLRGFTYLQMPSTYEDKLKSYKNEDFAFFHQLLDVILTLNKDIQRETVPKPLIEGCLLGLCKEV